MRILISISYYSPHISGLTNATKNIAELLTKNNYQVTVLATQHTKKLPKQEIIGGVTVKRIPYLFTLYKGFIMPGFIWEVYKALRHSDQVIINLPQAEGFIVAALAKLMRKKIHCLYHCNLVFDNRLRRAAIMKFIFYLADTITLSLTDSIVMSSEDFAKHTSLFTTYKKKIKIIPLVIQQPVNNNLSKVNLSKKLPPKKRYVVGFIGRIAAEKGIEYLLDTIPLLKKQFGEAFVIVLAGPERVVGEQAYLEKIKKYFEKYQDTIVRIGELKEHELGAFYQLLDVLVLPSVNNTEAFGMVQVEAMFCGTPVIASDLPGVRVPIKTTHMGKIVPSKDAAALSEAIITILKNKQSFTKNYQKVQSHFSDEKTLNQWRRLFAS